MILRLESRLLAENARRQIRIGYMASPRPRLSTTRPITKESVDMGTRMIKTEVAEEVWAEVIRATPPTKEPKALEHMAPKTVATPRGAMKTVTARKTPQVQRIQSQTMARLER